MSISAIDMIRSFYGIDTLPPRDTYLRSLRFPNLADRHDIMANQPVPIYIAPRRLIDEKIMCTVFGVRHLPVIDKKWGLFQKIALFNLELEYTQRLYANWLNIMKSYSECPVCFEFKPSQRLGCGHTVCKICFKEMLMRGINSTCLHHCPLCRKPISREHFAQYKISDTMTQFAGEEQIGQPLTAADLYRFHNMGSRTDSFATPSMFNREVVRSLSELAMEMEFARSMRQARVVSNIVRDTLATLNASRITEDDIDVVSAAARVGRQER